MYRAKNAISKVIAHNTPDKLLPKAKKLKSPRNVICKVDHPPNQKIVHIVYVKLTNTTSVVHKEHWTSKIDCAGIFTTQADAQRVADCMNRLFDMYHIHDQYYRMRPTGRYRVEPIRIREETVFAVFGYYNMVSGNIKPKQFVAEYIVGIARNSQELGALMAVNIFNDKWWQSSYFRAALSWDNTLRFDHRLYVARYKMNDVMPTMNLDHYNVRKHKQVFKAVAKGLQTMASPKHQKSLIEDLKTLPHS